MNSLPGRNRISPYLQFKVNYISAFIYVNESCQDGGRTWDGTKEHKLSNQLERQARRNKFGGGWPVEISRKLSGTIDVHTLKFKIEKPCIKIPIKLSSNLFILGMWELAYGVGRYPERCLLPSCVTEILKRGRPTCTPPPAAPRSGDNFTAPRRQRRPLSSSGNSFAWILVPARPYLRQRATSCKWHILALDLCQKSDQDRQNRISATRYVAFLSLTKYTHSVSRGNLLWVGRAQFPTKECEMRPN